MNWFLWVEKNPASDLTYPGKIDYYMGVESQVKIEIKSVLW